jgi:hypothetical protein
MRSTVILAAVAVAAALVPIPPELVERWYSRGVYPVLQRALTPASSAMPFALLDVVVPVAVAAWILFVIRRWRRHGAAAGLRGAAVSAVTATSILYLVFFALWGLNYRRLTLEAKLAYDPTRVTRDAIRGLAETAVERLNTLRAPGNAPSADREALAAAFARTQRHLGAARTAVPAPPKRSMFSWYLRSAGIDGMMNPFFLEIILNPDVLPVERPFSLAHEWAHLAGYANESEANFVAWLTCLDADGAAQYSGWIEAFRYAVVSLALPRDEWRALHQRLAPEVLGDLRAINERLGRADPAVSGFARHVYDSYLRSQGVEEGIASYGAMLRLMVGTTFENGWVPRRRD